MRPAYVAYAGGVTRHQPIRYEDLSDEQRRVYDHIAAGPRGGVGGPFHALLRSPELCDRVQHLGEFLRYHSAVSPALREIAILTTARHWDADFEWHAHSRIATRHGVAPSVVEAIASRATPQFTDESERVVHDLAHELVTTGSVSDDVFDTAVRLLGELQVVELVSIVGYYCLVSLVLNAFQVPVP
jgi:4-carboxymuconolactone decarboxylase